jgi:hypothetical protein
MVYSNGLRRNEKPRPDSDRGEVKLPLTKTGKGPRTLAIQPERSAAVKTKTPARSNDRGSV